MLIVNFITMLRLKASEFEMQLILEKNHCNQMRLTHYLISFHI